MILSFHVISVLISNLIEKRKWKRALNEFGKIQQLLHNVNSNQPFAYHTHENELKFDPPVYRQRYGTVHEVLLNEKWRKDVGTVVEFGCAEFGLFIYLKNLIGIREINFVDIDRYLLKENIFRVNPLNGDYLKMRTEPLTVNVFCGSIADPDNRIMTADVVIGIEIIEHLYPDVLEEVPYTVFHCIQPKIAIFTTPNSDFNEILPNLKGFRHYDHKFEWTRQQFESWASNITDRFPQYFASFNGIGRGPEGNDSLGCCSQMVVFVRRDIIDQTYAKPIQRCYADKPVKDCLNNSPMRSFGICTYFSFTKNNNDPNDECLDKKDFSYYELIRTVDYPFERDDRSIEEKIMDDIKYRMNLYAHYNSRFYNSDTDRTEIPLSHLTSTCDGSFVTKEEVETLLRKHNYKLEECAINPEENEKEICLIYELEMENESSSESENLDNESGHSRYIEEASSSDWDNESLSGEGQEETTAADIFPAWLLQLLRVHQDEALVEGPHFMCQGDGQGVHPAIDNDYETADTISEVSASDEEIIETPNENPERENNQRRLMDTRSTPLSLPANPDGINEELALDTEESDVFFDSTDEE